MKGEPRPEPEPEDGGFADPPAPAEIDLAQVHGSILREPPEPAEGQGRVPVWFAIVILALGLWGAIYLANRSGGFRADVFAPMAAQPVPPVDPATLGLQVYVRNCTLCHQMNGMGVAGQYPPLNGSEWVLGREGRHEGQLAGILLHGIEGPFVVRGKVYNAAMPTWQFLRNDEIAAVLNYIRNSWDNAAEPITPEFIGQVRAATRGRVSSWSQPELLTLPPMPPATGNSAPGPDGH